jgi:hypothetical protein
LVPDANGTVGRFSFVSAQHKNGMPPRHVRNLPRVWFAGAFEVLARPAGRYDFARRDLLWHWLWKIQDQGRSMPIYHDSVRDRTQFSLFHRSLMESGSSPLAAPLSDQRIAQVFAEEGISFGEDDGVYSPAIALWALLSQVFFKAEQRSCLAAVVRVAALWLSWRRVVSSTNTGAYCRARRQLTGEALQKISRAIATDVLQADAQDAPHRRPVDVGIGPAAEYLQGRLILVDGFTVTAADTEANQVEYPQNPAQQAGLGFPILRGVALTCMHTGILLDAAVGPYSGKGTGETALLWKLLDALRPGDLVVADSYYCTYGLLAECRRRGAYVVMRNHHLRDDSPQYEPHRRDANVGRPLARERHPRIERRTAQLVSEASVDA